MAYERLVKQAQGSESICRGQCRVNKDLGGIRVHRDDLKMAGINGHADVLLDRAGKRVALVPGSWDTGYSTYCRTKKQKSVKVAAGKIFTELGLKSASKRIYPLTVDPINNMCEIDFNHPIG